MPMSNKDRTLVTVAVIGLIGVIGAAVIGTFDKPPPPTFSKETVAQPEGAAAPAAIPYPEAWGRGDERGQAVQLSSEDAKYVKDKFGDSVWNGEGGEGWGRITFDAEGRVGHYTGNGGGIIYIQGRRPGPDELVMAEFISKENGNSDVFSLQDTGSNSLKFERAGKPSQTWTLEMK